MASYDRPVAHSFEQAIRLKRVLDEQKKQSEQAAALLARGEGLEAMLEFMPQATLFDGMGSTEGGMGVKITRRGETVETGRFFAAGTTKVFSSDGRACK